MLQRKKNHIIAVIVSLFLMATIPAQANATQKAGAKKSYPAAMVTVTSPAYRADIKTAAVPLTFYAPNLTAAKVSCWHQPDSLDTAASGYEKTIADSLKPDARGKFSVSFPAAAFPHGPITIKIHAWSKDTTDDCFLQLYNTVGVVWREGLPPAPPAAAGMELVFADDFIGPLSISRFGRGTLYTSVKPDPDTGEFGDAVFESFEGPNNPFYQVDSYLRIRVTKQDSGFKDPKPWKRTHTGGLISSLRMDRTGISAKLGYFECRMVCPNAQGTWPAFWLMTTKNYQDAGNELDLIEAYGRGGPLKPDDTAKYQAAWHYWGKTHTAAGATIHCNWYMTPHIYGCKVNYDSTIYYVDNKEVWRFPTLEASKHQPIFFMVNLAIGGGWPTDLSRYKGIVDMYVDYVRVYQPVEAAAAPVAATTVTPAAPVKKATKKKK